MTSYQEKGTYYDNTAEARRDTLHDAYEQLYKEISVLQELSDKLRSRLTPVLLPEPLRDDGNAKLTAVNNSSPFVGQLYDMRSSAQNVVAVLMEIDRRLTL